MKPIRVENGRIVYYGNFAGHVAGGLAIMDPMFQSRELTAFLEQQRTIREIKWTEGVFERLMAGQTDSHTHEAQGLKKCRVWQLKPEVDVRMKFIGYDEMLRDFEPPSPLHYQAVFDGAVETNRLEELYNKFRTERPEGYTGHLLSISDVLELYDETGSSFYYVDSRSFQEIAFETEQPELEADSVVEFYHRIDREYAAYIKQMETRPQAELIRRAAEIAKMTEVYHSLRNNPYLSFDPADGLIQLDHPLEAIRNRLPEEPVVHEEAIFDAYDKAGYEAFYKEQEAVGEMAVSAPTMQF